MKKYKSEVELLTSNILDAAYDVFSTNGYSKTNLQDIADKLGISRTPLYYHYRNKYELYCTTSERYLNWKLREYRKNLAAEKPLFEKIKAHMHFCIDIGAQENVFFLESRTDPSLAAVGEMWNAVSRSVWNAKMNLAKEAIRTGEVRSDADPVEFVLYMYAMYYGVIGLTGSNLNEISRDKTRLKRLIDVLVDGMISIYQPHSSEALPKKYTSSILIPDDLTELRRAVGTNQ
ncbi:MAG TPA: TetR/AcrR family transcriptional regulator [Oscillospiraceae bacterium]|nr:TetR/AcrR family transcriptional regulator [Oscillospiraceae bacterium]